jgi:predicted metal-dependent enzyme (double-stranded beta helix superfamily)
MTSTTHTRATSALAELVADLDEAVRRYDGDESWATVDAVTQALRWHIRRTDLLTDDQRIGDPARYRQHRLHVADDGAFSVVALVWLPGQATPIHDHLSWCVVGVHQGEEAEVRYRLVDDAYLVEEERRSSPTGSVDGLLPPGDIHLVRNAGTSTAISLHVYGTDLRQSGTSIRRVYDLPILPVGAA